MTSAAARQPNGHVARSAETRARLIEAAMEVFGNYGLDGASTRTLTDHAQVSLAAISYHFGGKRELFHAAAVCIADYGTTLMDEIDEQLRLEPAASPHQRIEQITRLFCRAIIGGSEPQTWVDFFVRCGKEAPREFDLIYSNIFGRFESMLTRAIAGLSGEDPDDETLRLRVTAIIAPIMAFRTNRQALLDRFRWPSLSPERIAQLETVILEAVRNNFLTGKPGNSDKGSPRGTLITGEE
jgi:TetR/AcrR family transcriptional regulator, regulator of cefoperazone and chloramphenicol sensitivity